MLISFGHLTLLTCAVRQLPLAAPPTSLCYKYTLRIMFSGGLAFPAPSETPTAPHSAVVGFNATAKPSCTWAFAVPPVATSASLPGFPPMCRILALHRLFRHLGLRHLAPPRLCRRHGRPQYRRSCLSRCFKLCVLRSVTLRASDFAASLALSCASITEFCSRHLRLPVHWHTETRRSALRTPYTALRYR